MYRVEITPDMIGRVKDRYSSESAYKGHYIQGGKGRFWGFLAEEVLSSTLKVPLNNTYDYDLIYNNKTWDVKAKTRRYPPRGDFDGSVYAASMHQKTDNYIFVSIVAPQGLKYYSEEDISSFNYKEAYICGHISKEKFLEQSIFHEDGEVDNNGVTYIGGVYTISYDKLSPITDIL